MSERHEAGENRWDLGSRLTPEQEVQLLQAVRRFEPYLEVSSYWPATDSKYDWPEVKEAFYDVANGELCVSRAEGIGEIEATWSMMIFIENVTRAAEASADVGVKIEHRHHLFVTAQDKIYNSCYERIDRQVDHETGRLEKIWSPEDQTAFAAFYEEADSKAAVKIIVDSVKANLEKRKTLEAITGIDTGGFTMERFDRIMALLSEAEPANKKLQ